MLTRGFGRRMRHSKESRAHGEPAIINDGAVGMSLGYVPCTGSDQLALGLSRFSTRQAQCPICRKIVGVTRGGMIVRHTRLAAVGRTP
jgi:hypothetical protein